MKSAVKKIQKKKRKPGILTGNADQYLREAERDRETLGKKYALVEEHFDAFRDALWDYAQCLARHRKRFKTDSEFRIWITENGWDDFGRDDVSALLAMAGAEDSFWRDTVNMSSVYGPARPGVFFKEMVARGQIVTAPVTDKN